ncbi:LysR substrate-binding domain-containing protein [Streptomyces sp. NBC_00868]|uniref:LysR substrate-binding domain-containing protein n=1 Tax=Streptomyces sp. NBC_00868 TaxID=2903683 RepID=UPI00386C15E2|nr:LysR substrate-binding domain-containing protein [Streptomyces sp. NBC_00868]
MLRSDDYAVVQGFVAAGTGVALVPRLALGAPRKDLVVRPLEGPPLAREISVAVLRPTASGSGRRPDQPGLAHHGAVGPVGLVRVIRHR